MSQQRRGTRSHRALTARRRLALALLVAATLGASTGLGPHPAGADPIPADQRVQGSEGPPSPDQVFAAIQEADQDVARTAFDLQGATDELGRRQAAQQQAQGARDAAALVVTQRTDELNAAVRLVARRKAAVQAQMEDLRTLAQESYVAGDPEALEDLRTLIQGDTTDLKGRTAVMFKQVLKHETTQLRADRRAQAAAEQLVRERKAALADAQAQLDQAQRALDAAAEATRQQEQARTEASRRYADALDRQAAAKARLRSLAQQAPGQISLDTPILGAPRLDAEDLAGWFAQSTYRPAVATPVADFARWFIDEGRQEGLRGDIAFAQAVLETGGFTNNDSVNANNYSGIGHCDTCGSGWRFPSPQMGVRAQIQLLKSYALKNPSYVNPLVDRRLRGPAGCCPTWGDLTRKWATAPNYGPVVMGIYTQIVDYALKRHAALL